MQVSRRMHEVHRSLREGGVHFYELNRLHVFFAMHATKMVDRIEESVRQNALGRTIVLSQERIEWPRRQQHVLEGLIRSMKDRLRFFCIHDDDGLQNTIRRL